MTGSQKYVLITGASRGLGYEFCRQLLTHTDVLPEFFGNSPITVIACARSLEKAEQLYNLQKDLVAHDSQKRSLIIVQCDVSNEDDIKRLPTTLCNDHQIPHLDLFISNAGIIEPNPECDISDVTSFDESLDIIKVNAIAPALLTNALRALLEVKVKSVVGDLSNTPQFSSVTDGQTDLADGSSSPRSFHARCIYVSSTLGSITHINTPFSPAYRASKAALNTYVKTFQLKFPYIGFLALSPGWVATDMGSRGGRSPPTTPHDSVKGMLHQADQAQNYTLNKLVSFDGDNVEW